MDEDAVDQEMGVALVFDRDDDEEDGGDDFGVVREDNDVGEDEEGEEANFESEVKTNLGDNDTAVSSDHIIARDIDAFWLQRRLGKYSDDAIETQRLADEVLTALKVRSSWPMIALNCVGLRFY